MATIYDKLGLVLSKKLDTASRLQTIKVNALKSSIYVIQLYSENHYRTEKVILK